MPVARHLTVSAVSSDFIILDEAQGDERNVDQVTGCLAGLVARVLPDRPDLIVLPEVCDRPDNFEMPRRTRYYERRGDRILSFFRQTARENACWIVYPTERQDETGAWRNAAWVIDRRGEVVGVYDKMFVTISQMQEDGFSCSAEARLFDTELGRAGMAICFDLNFPRILEEYEKARPDLIIFPSHFHGSFVAEYWAYATRAWFLGAIARHDCYLVSPAGNVVARSGPGRRCLTARINLDRCVVHCEWEDLAKLDALKMMYGTGAGITEAGFGGNYLVTSEALGTSAETMVRAAGLTTLDDHLRLHGRRGQAWHDV
jgi:apolipoprotein N-acyltransferase